MKIQKKAFTMVELVISIMIIAILASIWFYSYVWYLSDARDAERKWDIWLLISSLNVYKQNRWWYPKPWESYNITNSWTTVAYQWLMDKSVTLTNLDSLPFDPYKWNSYGYSVTNNKQESQVTATLENWDFPIALLEWSYHSVSYKILPTIVLAIKSDEWSSVEIADWIWSWSENRQKFLLNKWKNLFYDINPPFEPVYWYTWEDLWDNIIPSWTVEYWQNSDYRNCQEIEDAWKSIWNWEYQIQNTWWLLEDTTCTF